MPKITRYVQNLFGNLVGAAGNYGKFGSLAAGTPQFTKDPKEIQSLDAWNLGWVAATVGNKSPALQDRNSLDFLAFYQLAYLMQQGVPEWNADTTYFINQFASSGGKIYKSLVNDNFNEPVTNSNNWIEYVRSVAPSSYEKTYLFQTVPNLLSTSTLPGGFTAIDLSSQIVAAGLNVAGITVKAAIVTTEVRFGPGGFGQYTAFLQLLVWGNTGGTGLKTQILATADDSNCSAADTNTGPVPLENGTTLYWLGTNTGNATGRVVIINLLGFIYEQALA
jgi:hypothetical protein